MVSVTGANPDNETYNVTIQPGAGKWASLGIETGQDDSLPGANIARGSERFIVTEVDAELSGAGDKPASKLPFIFAASDVAPLSPAFPPWLPSMAIPRPVGAWLAARGARLDADVAIRATGDHRSR